MTTADDVARVERAARALVVEVRGGAVLCVRDGRLWTLDGGSWVESTARLPGGRVLPASEVEALFARVGAP